jgi:AraC-like DNA-binding protein
MAETRSAALADVAAAHGLEQQLLHALIDCMGVGPIGQETPTERRHRDILSRLEELLQIHMRLRISDVRAALGVSERLLRNCCSEQLGMALNRYIHLRRMQQVHRALRTADPQSTTVSEEASRRGFRELGRFANDYRVVYGELPSATLRRHSTGAFKTFSSTGSNLTDI